MIMRPWASSALIWLEGSSGKWDCSLNMGWRLLATSIYCTTVWRVDLPFTQPLKGSRDHEKKHPQIKQALRRLAAGVSPLLARRAGNSQWHAWRNLRRSLLQTHPWPWVCGALPTSWQLSEYQVSINRATLNCRREAQGLKGASRYR